MSGRKGRPLAVTMGDLAGIGPDILLAAFARTSPDHRTASPIAGSSRAVITSYGEALHLADALAARRVRLSA